MLALAQALLLAATAAEPAFSFGSYGRLQLGYDLADRPGRPTQVVSHGPRLVEPSYLELDFDGRIVDPRGPLGTSAHLVGAVGVGEDMFHYTGEFHATLAVRNMYVRADDILAKGLSLWAGSRMVRGDDLYLLDFWPLDNLNTLGGGAAYKSGAVELAAHAGANRLDNDYQLQVLQAAVEDGVGARPDPILERQRTVTALRGTLELDGAKLRLYGERHDLPAGQKRNRDSGEVQAWPRDSGWVLGAQASGWTKGGLNGMAVVKLGTGLGAFGELAEPSGFALDRSLSGARLFLAALGGSLEKESFAIPVAAYFASFRDASGLEVTRRNYEELSLDARPTWFASDVLHLALDLSWQLRAPHTLTADGARPLSYQVGQIGLMPIIAPGGTGLWSRPAIRLIYAVRFLSPDARAQLFAEDDPRRDREVSQFVGAGVEWWFNSSYR